MRGLDRRRIQFNPAGIGQPHEFDPDILADPNRSILIGYLSHNDDAVRLYLQETFTFLLLTSEASVALTPSTKTETV